ncbi:BZ3500_MvSof-1268-A1-R1_Chr5-2g07883 [Microbotryum saponariae]|uniref:BZ3500_MvSof-1268-A1-R1_Chr5-2g07883 protein n=1 Tax=Microbotryum saponariae TaxID=289078 RepID=A0A2X0ML41_9BASI|nr:BZ3500_MvSof-1268-A1-R1_Chr5-2g07883 [Microbotryum saponariae]
MSPWLEAIRSQLIERDKRESSHRTLIAHSQRLAQHAAMLHQRNQALLNASLGQNSGGTGAGTVGGPGGTSGGQTTSGAVGGTAGTNDVGRLTRPRSRIVSSFSAVRQAMITSLESQLASTRHELAEQYKIQSTNAQRLLGLTDQLREFEDKGREEKDELRRLRTEVEGLRDRAKWHKEVVQEKERQLVILQDDLSALELELNQVTKQNKDLKTDNAGLLQRWLEAKNDEARRMNELFSTETTRAKGMSSSPIAQSTSDEPPPDITVSTEAEEPAITS